MRTLFAQLENKLLQGDALRVFDADKQVTQLRQEELNLRVAKLAQLLAEKVVDSYMVCITAVDVLFPCQLLSLSLCVCVCVGVFSFSKRKKKRVIGWCYSDGDGREGRDVWWCWCWWM